MFRRENVLGSIHITIMMCAAFRTSPFSYSKTCDTSRPAVGQGATIATTGLGGIRFIDLLEQYFSDGCKDFEANLVAFDGENDPVHLWVNYPPKGRYRIWATV
jgi:hypothetical protein